ncbi:MAG: tRNA (adenosine(37)-N6)-threonylcarbamoyltransferase complex dimerization subunit type 1 TsaB [Verrucomicrobiota bacterium]
MKILALELSSDVRSVAVLDANTGAAASARETGGKSAHTLGLVEQVLREAGFEREAVECVAIGIGPGSYTGIRLGISFAQGWSIALPVKILGISSVECMVLMAAQKGREGLVDFAVDAQRGEFYLASYALLKGEYREVEPLHLASLEELKQRHAAGRLVLGPEVADIIPGTQAVYPNAVTLAQLAAGRTDFITGEELKPIYLRQTDFVKAPPLRVIG